MKTIFISYARADADFAHPLEEALKEMGYSTWIDHSEILMGDSIFARIAEGLNKADFGVVILSPAYTNRTWTRREFVGLLNLEEQTGKVILPVWKDITKEGVGTFSGGMMNDRMSGMASDGVSVVAAMINGAIEGGERRANLAPRNRILGEFKALSQRLEDERAAMSLLSSPRGGELVRASYDRLATELEKALAEVRTDQLPFKVEKRDCFFTIFTGTRVYLQVGAMFSQGGHVSPGFIANRGDSALLIGSLFRRNPTTQFEERKSPDTLRVLHFFPAISSGSVQWETEDDDRMAVEVILGALLEAVREELDGA